MTTIDVPSRERGRREKPSTPWTGLPKPVTADDVDRLHELARHLDGRPVPGVCMTEAQFEHWCDEDVKAEWVDGEVILMSPASWDQVTLGGWLFRLISEFVEFHDLGEVAGRDFMIRLPRQRRRRAPDLLFVAKERTHLIHPTFLNGAPDLVIEIVSPDSQSRDWRTKHREYERAGAREYWVFDPRPQRVEAYGLGKNKRYVRWPEQDGRIVSTVLPGFHFRPEWLRQAKLPRVATILKELGVRR